MISLRLLASLLGLLGLGLPAWGQERAVLVTAEGAGALTVLQKGRSETIPLGGRPHNLAVSPNGTPVKKLKALDAV